MTQIVEINEHIA